MDRQKLVGWIVRDQITNQGISYSDAARRWPISLPTLNRLMSNGNVGIRFYRTAELNLGLPHGLLEMVIDHNVSGIRELSGIEESLRELILRELGEPPAWNGPDRRRKAR